MSTFRPSASALVLRRNLLSGQSVGDWVLDNRSRRILGQRQQYLGLLSPYNGQPLPGVSGGSSSSSRCYDRQLAPQRIARRGFADGNVRGTGEKTLSVVVRELRRQGRLPSVQHGPRVEEYDSSSKTQQEDEEGAEFFGGDYRYTGDETEQPPVATGRSPVIDIDAELMSAAAGEGEDDEAGDYPCAGDMDGLSGEAGFDDDDEVVAQHSGRGRRRRGSPRSRQGSASRRELRGVENFLETEESWEEQGSEEDEEEEQEDFAQMAILPEEELRERVRQSIEQLVPPETSEAASAEGSSGISKAGLTPAQLFYLENKDALIRRAQDYYVEMQQEMAQQDGEHYEDEWRYYQDPVVRPQKGHLWSTGEEEDGAGDAFEQDWLETVSSWPTGQVPSAEMLADLLRREQAKDVCVVDLQACGRHDLGTHGIIGTGVTTGHCRRLGQIAMRAVQWCQVPHLSAFCHNSRNDEWVTAHCGPLKVHLLTREAREAYQLELLWERPEEFFQPGDFPHYLEYFGSALDSSPNGYIVDASGTRGVARLPLPTTTHSNVHDALSLPDYSAADDMHYTAPAEDGQSGGRTSARHEHEEEDDENSEDDDDRAHFHDKPLSERIGQQIAEPQLATPDAQFENAVQEKKNRVRGGCEHFNCAA